MRRLKISALILALTLVFSFFTGCGFTSVNTSESSGGTETWTTDEDRIEQRIETFLTAYNEGDMEVVLQCLDAKTRNAFQAMLNILGGLAGSQLGFDISLSDLFSLGVNTTSGDFMGLNILSMNIVEGQSAVVTTSMTLHGSGTQTIYFEMTYEHGDWFIHDMTDTRPSGAGGVDEGSGENSGDSSSVGGGSEIVAYDYEILNCDPFVDGRAWVSYHDKNKPSYPTVYYYGFIDMQGHILYSTEYEGADVYNIGNGSGIVCTSTGITLIDENGQEVWRAEGSAEVKAYGEGDAWIYLNKSSLMVLEHWYGVINYAGEWVVPFQNLQEEGVYDEIEYVGDGLVMYNGYEIWNIREDISITIDNYNTRYLNFSNELAYLDYSNYFGSGGVLITVTRYDENGGSSTETYEVKTDCILYADGRVQEIGMWTAFSSGKVVTSEKILEGGQYLQITDYTKETPITVDFTAYPATMVENIVFNGDYGLVQLRGMDEDVYVAMIDVQGNVLIEPMQGKNIESFVLAPDGHLFYYGEDSLLYVMDRNGNVTNTEIEWFVEFYDDIGIISDYFNGLYYIKSNGEKLFEKLTKNN